MMRTQTSQEWLIALAPWGAFVLIALLIVVCNAFPCLYGDEYWSLREARDLALNPAAVGYFAQLNVLMRLTDSDWGLRALSLFWAAVSTWALAQWMQREIANRAERLVVVLLWVTNPFLWEFAQQVRFYSFFAAATVLTLWRFREWERIPKRSNLAWLIGSLILLCTSHFFSVLVVAALGVSYAWPRVAKRWRPVLVALAACAMLMVFVPSVREQIVLIEQRLHNQPITPGSSSRGMNPMTAAFKMFHALFSFSVGKRVYPLWLWLTVPALLVVFSASVAGLIRLRHQSGISRLLILLFLELIFVYFVADPIAPPSAPGVGPRHVIFVLPAFVILIGLGAANKLWFATAALGVQCAGLACLLFPCWSDDPYNLIDWKQQLAALITEPETTCVLVDGRAQEPVRRYLPHPARLRLIGQNATTADASCNRFLFISNDYRLDVLRSMEAAELTLETNYGLRDSVSLFPAQISVYSRPRSETVLDFRPSRLDLPEQDLRLPLRTNRSGVTLAGFVRLDADRPQTGLACSLPASSRLLIATNYRSAKTLKRGTPVAQLTFEHENGTQEQVLLQSGEETAAWDCVSADCFLLAGWTKRAHLLGRAYYPGAYKEFEASVWGTILSPRTDFSNRLHIRSLLEDGTFYFWGIFPSIEP